MTGTCSVQWNGALSVNAVCVIEKEKQNVRTIRVEKSRMGRAGNAVL